MSSGQAAVTRSRLVSFTFAAASGNITLYFFFSRQQYSIVDGLRAVVRGRRSSFDKSIGRLRLAFRHKAGTLKSSQLSAALSWLCSFRGALLSSAIRTPATYISKKLPSGNKAFCILARSNDVGIFRDESASIVVRPSHPDLQSNRALANARTHVHLLSHISGSWDVGGQPRE